MKTDKKKTEIRMTALENVLCEEMMPGHTKMHLFSFFF